MTETPPPAPPAAPDEHDALRAGSRLDEFEILRVLGVGGFGIVYLAMDHALERQVAIKEYMPGTLAVRGQSSHVSLRSASHEETFGIGLRSFVNEAKLLARFDNPSLVKVYRFWEANGTAYMVMPFYPGRTLKEERRAIAQTPADAWMRSVIDPLLGALEVLHREDVFHRDIAPDNILLTSGGQPVLLDFGAARRVIGDRTQSLTAILKPNFAPIEQYADVNHLRQGPWTDLYALGAVLHFMVTGKPPIPAAARAVHDELLPLAGADSPYSQALTPTLLRAIDWALAVRPNERPQSVQEFRDALAGRIVPPERVMADISMAPTMPADKVANAWSPTAPRESTAGAASPTLSARDTDFAATVVDDSLLTPPSLPKLPRQTALGPARARRARAAAAVATERPPKRRVGWVVIALGMVVVAVASWMLGARHEAREESSVAAAPAASAVAAGGVAPERAVEPAASEPTPVAAIAAASTTESRPKLVAQKASRSSRAASQMAAAPTPASMAPQADAAGPATPRQACGSRVFIAMFNCMRRECETARYRDHPQCKKLHREEESRDGREVRN